MTVNVGDQDQNSAENTDDTTTMNTNEIEQTEAYKALKRIEDEFWNTNWSELPPEAEGEAEEAYNHIMSALDEVENSQ